MVRVLTLQRNVQTSEQSRQAHTDTASVVKVVGKSGIASIRVAPWPSALQSARQTVLWADCSTQQQQSTYTEFISHARQNHHKDD